MCTVSPALNARASSSAPGRVRRMSSPRSTCIVSSLRLWYCRLRMCPAFTCRILPTYRSVRAHTSSWPQGLSTRYGTSGTGPPVGWTSIARRKYRGGKHVDEWREHAGCDLRGHLIPSEARDLLRGHSYSAEKVPRFARDEGRSIRLTSPARS